MSSTTSHRPITPAEYRVAADEPERTAQDVITLLEQAAEKLEAEQ